MTEEELKLEAEKFARTEMSHPNEYGMYYCTFLKVAEPRERRIEELEESNKEWQRTCEAKSDTNSQLIEQLADLEEKLANADYQLEGRDNEIRELEKQLKAEHTRGEIDFVNMHCNSSCKKVRELEAQIKTDSIHIRELQKDKGELTEQNTSLLTSVENLNKSVQELEAQIEKMKCCGNCSHFKLDNSGLYPINVCELTYPNRCKNHDKWEIKENGK